MDTLDKIIELQKQGLSEEEISQQLRNEGISPREINDSLNQARIKSAVDQNGEDLSFQEAYSPQNQSFSSNPPSNSEQQISSPNIQMQPPEPPSPEIYPPQENSYQNYYQETPQAYTGQEYYLPQGSMDTETISEIAEQIVSEKIEALSKKIGDISSFRTSTQETLQDLNERLKRIESSIDKLQHAVIGKIGEFGDDASRIHKDLDNLHGTVSKLMNPLIDNLNEFEKKKRRSKK